jgi:hypothetical protein
MLALEYEGKRYAFCCPYCRAHFLEECELAFIQSAAGSGSRDPEG